MTTIKIHNTKKSAIQDADIRSWKAIWHDREFGLFAVGDKEDLPTKVNGGSPIHCDWVELSREELEKY